MAGLRRAASIVALGASLAALSMPSWAEEIVRIGQIEAETGATATYGWMSAQGARMAVAAVNKAGGFTVGDKTYRLELVQMDTRGEPREALVQFRKLMEQKVPFVFGPFLSNVFNAIEPVATQNNGKFLLLTGATSAHASLGKPDHDYLIRTFNWDSGSQGFGTLIVADLKKRGVQKVAMLFQNDAFGKTAIDIYGALFKAAGISLTVDMFEPGAKDFSAVLAKIAAGKPDFLFPGYSDAVLYDIVRQGTEQGYATKFVIVRGSLGPALKNKDEVDAYVAYVPKYFEAAEKNEPAVASFIADYKAFYKRDFPYDQAPLCASSCYDHVFMLVDAMKVAGSVTDLPKIRAALLGQRYSGLWNVRFDETAEAVFSFDLVEMSKGGAITVTNIDPTK